MSSKTTGGKGGIGLTDEDSSPLVQLDAVHGFSVSANAGLTEWDDNVSGRLSNCTGSGRECGEFERSHFEGSGYS